MCLTSALQAAESKMTSYNAEISSLKHAIKELGEKLETANAKAQSYEKEARILEQEKIHLEQRYRSEFERFAEVQERCNLAEKESKRATELADKARADAVSAQKEKGELQKLAMERLAQIERAQRHIESLERQKTDLADDLGRVRVSEMDALSKVALLEARVEEREKEIESLLKSNNEERAGTVKALQDLLEAERKAHSLANKRAEDFSLQLEVARSKLDSLQQELTSVRLNESALDGKLKAASHGKRVRAGDIEMGVGSVQDMGTNDRRVNKRSRSTTSPVMHTQPEDGGSVFRGDEDSQSQQTDQEDYKKFNIQKLKQELTRLNFGEEVLKYRNITKKELVALYEKFVLRKS